MVGWGVLTNAVVVVGGGKSGRGLLHSRPRPLARTCRMNKRWRWGCFPRGGGVGVGVYDVTTQPTCPYDAGVEAGQQSPAGAGTEWVVRRVGEAQVVALVGERAPRVVAQAGQLPRRAQRRGRAPRRPRWGCSYFCRRRACVIASHMVGHAHSHTEMMTGAMAQARTPKHVHSVGHAHWGVGEKFAPGFDLASLIACWDFVMAGAKIGDCYNVSFWWRGSVPPLYWKSLRQWRRSATFYNVNMDIKLGSVAGRSLTNVYKIHQYPFFRVFRKICFKIINSIRMYIATLLEIPDGACLFLIFEFGQKLLFRVKQNFA